MTTSSGTKGFLFCDLRGYTAFVERRGDSAAAELLGTYRTQVRAVISRHDGAEIRTEGDSFYVVFPTASSAVEAGLAIVAAAAGATTPERRIRVGVGIHAGETVATAEGLVGGAVNIAARVCAKAEAGEVLVTETVRALTRTFLPYTYTSLGAQQLKGVAGSIALYRVEAAPVSRTARLRRQVAARRGRVSVGIALAAVLIAVAAGIAIANRGPDCLALSASTNDVVARIDPARGCIVATVAVGRRPAAIVGTSDAIWVANEADWTVTRVDPTHGKTRTVGVGAEPIAMAADPAGDIFALVRDDKTAPQMPDRAAEITAGSGELTELRALADCDPGAPGAVYTTIASFGGQLWVARSDAAGVINVTFGGMGCAPLGGSTAANVPADMTGPIAAGLGAVWIASSSSATLYRLGSGSARPEPIRLGGSGGTLTFAVSDRVMWLVRSDGSLTEFDPATGSVTPVTITGHPSAIAAVGADAWVTEPDEHAVVHVTSARAARSTTIEVGARPSGVAVASDGSVWITISSP